jgi:farnesyl-diphosphate farnesyltransferase
MHVRPLKTSDLLQGVSRSFGLTIRCLPAKVRHPVSLAYLLARTSDTLADTPIQPPALRQQLLTRLQQAIENPGSSNHLQRDLQAFAQQVQDPQERRLLMHNQNCLQALHQMGREDQAAIRTVLRAITEGQAWDLQRVDAPACGVSTRAEIDHYTWMVAGSVGEFWTRLCNVHLRGWHNASTDQLMLWGARYGKGLQRLNILRDAGRDLRMGRCYFPVEELQPLGLSPAQLCEASTAGDLLTLQRMAPLLAQWQAITLEQLQDGLHYSLALRGLRLRLATALPCLMGVRTLSLLKSAGPQALVTHQKVPRAEVRRLLLSLLLGAATDRQLHASWQAGLMAARAGANSAKIGS